MNAASPCTVKIADLLDDQELRGVIDLSFSDAFHLNRSAYAREMARIVPERLMNPERFTVFKCVTDERKILGTATGIWQSYFEQKGTLLPELGTLAVLPDHRGQKIAERLVAAVEEEAKARNFRGITLCHSGGFDIAEKKMDPRMIPLHRYYEKLGYWDLAINGKLQYNTTPKKDKFTTPENPSGRCFVVWMVKLFSDEVEVFSRVARTSPLSQKAIVFVF